MNILGVAVYVWSLRSSANYLFLLKMILNRPLSGIWKLTFHHIFLQYLEDWLIGEVLNLLLVCFSNRFLCQFMTETFKVVYFAIVELLFWCFLPRAFLIRFLCLIFCLEQCVMLRSSSLMMRYHYNLFCWTSNAIML